MQEIYPGIFRLPPSKVTDSKYISFFVRRPGGNLLLPCFSNSSTIHVHFDWIAKEGGLARQLLGDSHFKTPHCDEVAERFDAPLYCSAPEAPDVTRTVKRVVVFPFIQHELEPGVEVIPTPGHRPGGVCYRITQDGRRYLFVGDFIWHTDEGWLAYPTKAGRKQIFESLQTVADLDFDVLLAHARVADSGYTVEVTPDSRRAFIADIVRRLQREPS